MTTHIILRNEISEVQRLKATMVEYGNNHQIADEVIQDVNLVLEEAISNIIFYGYEDKKAHQIEVAMSLNETTLVFEIKDDGKPFNPLEAPEPDLEIPFEDREIGGMGIHLVRTLMDELAYRTEQGKNVLIMKKHLPPPLSGEQHIP